MLIGGETVVPRNYIYIEWERFTACALVVLLHLVGGCGTVELLLTVVLFHNHGPPQDVATEAMPHYPSSTRVVTEVLITQIDDVLIEREALPGSSSIGSVSLVDGNGESWADRDLPTTNFHAHDGKGESIRGNGALMPPCT